LHPYGPSSRKCHESGGAVPPARLPTVLDPGFLRVTCVVAEIAAF